jgi:hypothetical protein
VYLDTLEKEHNSIIFGFTDRGKNKAEAVALGISRGEVETGIKAAEWLIKEYRNPEWHALKAKGKQDANILANALDLPEQWKVLKADAGASKHKGQAEAREKLIRGDLKKCNVREMDEVKLIARMKANAPVADSESPGNGRRKGRQPSQRTTTSIGAHRPAIVPRSSQRPRKKQG